MPAPSVATYSAEAKIAAHNSLLALIDTGTAGSIKIRSAADVLLAQIPLEDPGGTVNGTTGQLTLALDGRDESADATGTMAYAEVCESDGTVHLAIPAQQGTVAVAGKIVANTLSVVAGAPFEIVSATIG